MVAVGFDKCSTHGSHGASKHVSMVAFPTVNQAVTYLREDKNCKSFLGLLGGVPDAYDFSGYSVAEENETHFVARQTKNETTFSCAKRSYPIHTRPFVKGNCCFVISKNPKELTNSLGSQCDFFVHIPHVNVATENDESTSWLLDVPSCLSIALHHFTAWAQYDERGFQGHKYEVGMTRQPSPEEKEAIRIARAKAREEASDDAIGVGGMFGEDDNDGDY